MFRRQGPLDGGSDAPCLLPMDPDFIVGHWLLGRVSLALDHEFDHGVDPGVQGIWNGIHCNIFVRDHSRTDQEKCFHDSETILGLLQTTDPRIT